MQEKTNESFMKVGNWGMAISNTRFRNKLILGMVLLIAILMAFPPFFAMIEARKGVIVNDWLLGYMKPYDFSIPVFIIIWFTGFFFLFRSVTQPAIFLDALYCMVILSIARMLAIYFIALEPPIGLIRLQDPITSISYGGKDIFITKDLFFSGHTSNMLLMALCFEKRSDRLFGFFAAITVGILVLFQHVHYSVDVIGAFVITFLLVKVGKKLAAF